MKTESSALEDVRQVRVLRDVDLAAHDVESIEVRGRSARFEQRDDLDAAREQRSGHRRADETRGAGDHDPVAAS